MTKRYYFSIQFDGKYYVINFPSTRPKFFTNLENALSHLDAMRLAFTAMNCAVTVSPDFKGFHVDVPEKPKDS